MFTFQLAEFYKTTEKIISQNFSRNPKNFVLGEDYFALEGKEKSDFLNHLHFEDGSKHAKTLYLWTEYGALMHAKSLQNDRALEVFRELRASYFLIQDAKQQPSAIPFNKDVQKRCIANEKLLPSGHWCVVNEMYKEALIVVPFQKELKDWSLPDGSCGRKWRSYCERESIDISQSFKHSLWVPNQKFLVGIYIYPYNLLDTFRNWLRVEYAQYYEHEYSPSRLKHTTEIDTPKKRGWLK